jgi:hypothetical protein
MGKPLIRIASKLIKSQTGYLTNASLQCYNYTNQLSFITIVSLLNGYDYGCAVLDVLVKGKFTTVTARNGALAEQFITTLSYKNYLTLI